MKNVQRMKARHKDENRSMRKGDWNKQRKKMVFGWGCMHVWPSPPHNILLRLNPLCSSSSTVTIATVTRRWRRASLPHPAQWERGGGRRLEAPPTEGRTIITSILKWYCVNVDPDINHCNLAHCNNYFVIKHNVPEKGYYCHLKTIKCTILSL